MKILAFLLLFTIGCSGLIVPDGKIDLKGFQERLMTLSKEDVGNALKLATEQSDPVGMMCWASAGQFLDEMERFKDHKGLAVTMQRIRGNSRGIGATALVEETCKPVIDSLVSSALETAAKVGIKIGGIAK